MRSKRKLADPGGGLLTEMVEGRWLVNGVREHRRHNMMNNIPISSPDTTGYRRK